MANFADLWEQTPTDSMAGLKGDFANRLKAANEAWQSQTGKPLPINSAYRTPEEGIKLWGNRTSNPNLVARPGTSLHEKGIAADISPDVPNEFLSQYGLHRPYGSKDPVHVEAAPNFKSKEASVTVSGAPQTNNFADLWESTGEVAPSEAKTTKPKGFMEIAKSAQESNKPIADIGKGLASLGDIALGIVPATVSGVTYAGARALQKTPEEAQALAQKVSAPLESPIGKAMGVTEKPAYKQEAVRQAMESIGQYIGEKADVISEKTGIPKSDVENMIQTLSYAAPGALGKLKGKAAQFLENRPLLPEELQGRFIAKGGQPRASVTVEGAPETFISTPESVAAKRAEIIQPPAIEPVNRAEVAPLKPNEINTNESLLNRVGIEHIRNSAVEMNPKEATSQYLTAKAEQGPYGQGMTDQINYEKNALTNHFGKIESDLGGIVPRTGTGFEITDKIEAGRKIKTAADEALVSHKTETDRLYKKASEEVGNVPVGLDSLKGYLDKKSNFVQSPEKSLRKGVIDYLGEQELLDKKGNVKPMTVKQSEDLRQFINSQYNYETKNKVGDLVHLIDDDVFKNVQGDTYEQARSHFAKGKEIFDNPKAMRDLLSDEGVNQKIADEKVLNKIVTLDESQFKHMVDIFQETGKTQALDQVKTSLINRIKEAGQSSTNEPWNSIAAAKERAKLSEKLRVAFSDSPELLQKIDDGIAAGNIIYIPTKYPGAAVQKHLLQNKFIDVGIRRAFGSMGGAAGAFFGNPVTAAGGAMAGEAVGGKVSQAVTRSGQQKALKKEIKYKQEEKTSLKDIGK